VDRPQRGGNYLLRDVKNYDMIKVPGPDTDTAQQLTQAATATAAAVYLLSHTTITSRTLIKHSHIHHIAQNGFSNSHQTPNTGTKIPPQKPPHLPQNHSSTQRIQHPRMVLRPRTRLRPLLPLPLRNLLWQTPLPKRIPVQTPRSAHAHPQRTI
jgi:hypothetical protein